MLIYFVRFVNDRTKIDVFFVRISSCVGGIVHWTIFKIIVYICVYVYVCVCVWYIYMIYIIIM